VANRIKHRSDIETIFASPRNLSPTRRSYSERPQKPRKCQHAPSFWRFGTLQKRVVASDAEKHGAHGRSEDTVESQKISLDSLKRQ